MDSSSQNEFKFFKLILEKSKFNNFETLFEINTRFLVERFGRTLDLKKKIHPNEEIEVNDMALDILSSIICGPTKILLSDPKNIKLLEFAIKKQLKYTHISSQTKEIYNIVLKNFENILENCKDESFIDKFPTFNYPDESSPTYQSAWRLPIVSFEVIEEIEDSWQEEFYDYMDNHFKYIEKLYNKENLSEDEIKKAYQNFSSLVTYIKCTYYDHKITFKYVATTYGDGKNKDNSIGMYINQIQDDGRIALTNDKRYLISFEKISTIKSRESGDNNLSFIREVFLQTI